MSNTALHPGIGKFPPVNVVLFKQCAELLIPLKGTMQAGFGITDHFDVRKRRYQPAKKYNGVIVADMQFAPGSLQRQRAARQLSIRVC